MHSWLPHGALNGSNGWTHNLEASNGIFLINQLMDKVEFRKNGTEIHMVKR